MYADGASESGGGVDDLAREASVDADRGTAAPSECVRLYFGRSAEEGVCQDGSIITPKPTSGGLASRNSSGWGSDLRRLADLPRLKSTGIGGTGGWSVVLCSRVDRFPESITTLPSFHMVLASELPTAGENKVPGDDCPDTDMDAKDALVDGDRVP